MGGVDGSIHELDVVLKVKEDALAEVDWFRMLSERERSKWDVPFRTDVAEGDAGALLLWWWCA